MLLGAANAIAATPSLQGQSGYINMPSAAVEADGTFSLGYSYDRPYGSLWTTATILPFLQVTGRYVSISGTRPVTTGIDPRWIGYGRYKDKVADAKLRLWNESEWLPSVAVGATDLLGTELFKGQYLVATKTFGNARNFEATVGYGHGRPDGLFAGARFRPVSAPNWVVVAEYDANDYSKDFRAASTDAGKRSKGPAVGLEYQWGWLGAQIARHRDHFSANVYASIPFSQREFIPKFAEPAYFQPKDAPASTSIKQWQDDPRLGAALVQALAKQDFKNIRVSLDGTALNLTLTNNRISNLGRAVGRASRTALAFAPQGTRSIRITYTSAEQPFATYEFADLRALSDYLTGLTSREAFLPTVVVRYATPGDSIHEDRQGMLAQLKDDAVLGVQVGRDGNMVQLSSEDRESNRFKLVPRLGFFFNDPSGALRYEVAAAGTYDRRLGEGRYLNGAFKLNLFENVSGVTQPSSSLLPHVRSDIAEYKRGDRFKLQRLMLNQFLNPDERVYARLSAGFYEEMYRGVGGQLLYLPNDSRWAADVSVDALQQRGVKGWFDKRDYSTVTALGAIHYRLPYELTATARAGRFLAKDKGVRLEFKRRFASGIEVGAWYTYTNGNDITKPGSPTNPYHDKGVFLNIPLSGISPADTQANAAIAIAPWTRDVGQMVATPGDLYDMLEQPRRDVHSYDGLGNFGERADEQNLPAVNPPVRPLGNPWPAFRMRVEQAHSTLPSLPDWVEGNTFAAGAVLASALLDKPVDRYVQRHDDSALRRGWANAGKAIPVALVGAAGATLFFGDDRMQNTGIIAMESVAGALGLTMGGKYIVGRARPSEERGPWSLVGPGVSRSEASFPSGHSAVAFAAVTPFAQEYNAPWLYAVAAVGASGRIAGRQHWVSDVVAGGAIGYTMGNWLWESQRNNSSTSRWSIAPGIKALAVSWRTTY